KVICGIGPWPVAIGIVRINCRSATTRDDRPRGEGVNQVEFQRDAVGEQLGGSQQSSIVALVTMGQKSGCIIEGEISTRRKDIGRVSVSPPLVRVQVCEKAREVDLPRPDTLIASEPILIQGKARLRAIVKEVQVERPANRLD